MRVCSSHTRKTGHVHTVRALNLSDDSVSSSLRRQGSEEDNS